ncbi:MAG: PAS domain-containing protein [Pseudomonadota bacterium]
MIDRLHLEGKGPGEAAALERVSAMFERSPVALTLADAYQPDMPLIIANQAFLTLSGYERDEVVGRNCRFLQGRRDNVAARLEIRETITEAGQAQVLLHNVRKNGEPFDNLLFLQALVERDGRARYFIGSQFELTDAVTAERIDRHVTHVDAAVGQVVAAQHHLRAEQRRMFANAAHAVALTWLATLK